MDDPRAPIRPEELLAEAGWLRRLALGLAGPGVEAQDLEQDTWLAALRRPPGRGESLRPWLARVLRNRARNARRDQAHRLERESERASAEPARATDEVAAELELQRALFDALLELGEPERTIVTLRYFRELDSRAIGERLGMPAASVRWRLARAIGELRARLDARYGGSRQAWAGLLMPLGLLPAGEPAGVGGVALVQGALWMSGITKLCVAVMACTLAGWWLLGHEPEKVDLVREGSAIELPADSVGAARESQSEPSSARAEVRLAGLERAAGQEPASRVAESAARELQPQGFQLAIVRALVLDLEGRPIEGARLAPLRSVSAASATSDASGELELSLPMAFGLEEWSEQLALSASGCSTLFVKPALRCGQVSWLGELRLAAGCGVRGRVVDLAGAPIPGARVRVQAAELPSHGDEDVWRRQGPGEYGDESSRELYEPLGHETLSAADGSFLLEGLAPGSVRLWAKSDGMRYGWTDALELSAGELLEGVDLALERLRREDRIAGRLVDPAGAPLPGAQVIAHYDTRGRVSRRSLTTDDEGRFELVVRFAVPHSFSARDWAGRYGEAAVEGIPPGTHDLLLQLQEPRRIEVRARDERGAELERFELSTVSADGMTTTSERAERSEGRVLMRMPGFAFHVEVRAEGFRRERQGPFLPARAPERLDFVLRELPVVTGRVTIDGRPAQAAKVEFALSYPRWDVSVHGFPARALPVSLADAVTGADGRFRIPIEHAGEYYVRAQRADRAPAEVGPFAFGAGPMPEELLIELPRGGVLEGRVLLPDGADGVGTVVGLNRGDGLPLTQRAGPGGTYRFERLAPGDYELVRRPVEIDPSRRSYAEAQAGQRFAPNCTVVDGRTTRFDLDSSHADGR